MGRGLAVLLVVGMAGMVEASGALAACSLESSIVPNRGGGFDVFSEAPYGIVPGVERHVTEGVVVARAYAKAARTLFPMMVFDNFGTEVSARSVSSILDSGVAGAAGEGPEFTCHAVVERDRRGGRAFRVCIGEGTLGVVEVEVLEGDGALHVRRSTVTIDRSDASTSVAASSSSETHTVDGELAYVVGGGRLSSGHLSETGREVVAVELLGTDQACVRVYLLGVDAVPGLP